MNRMFRALLCLGLLVLPAAVVSAEDITVVSDVSFQGKTQTSTQYITEGKVRTSDGKTDTILDYKTGRIIQIDHKKKRFTETTLDELQAHMGELQAMVEGNPIMERMFGAGGNVDVTKHGETREVAGYTCVRYTLTLGEKMRFEIWAAPELAVPITYHDARKMAYAAMGPIGARFDKMFEEMKEIEGLPLASSSEISVLGMDLDSEQTATEVRFGPIAPEVFEPPAGYKASKKSAFKG